MPDAIAASVGNGQVIEALQYDFGSGQVVAIGATAASSTAFVVPYTAATITSTTNCWYSIGATAVAHGAASEYLPAGLKIKVKFAPGQTISVIQDTAAGFLSITPASIPNFGPLLLNAVPLASAAYSLRLLTTTYSGPCITVRRSSDNTTQNIGFTASGDLNVAALNAFIGAGNGFVATWYDQSGNARNVSQATLGNQPRLIASDPGLGGKPNLSFTAASGLLTGTIPATTLPLTLSAVLVRSTGSNFINMFSIGPTNQPALYFSSTPSQVGAGNWGIDGITSTALDGWGHAVGGIYNVASSFIYVDGTSTAGALSSHLGATIINLGSNVVSGDNARMSEAIYWSSNLGATLTTVQTNQKAYWGTP